MAKNYFDHIHDNIESMTEHDRLLLAKKIIDKVSYYDEPFEKMLKIMNLFYRNMLEFESGEYDALLNERVESALDEFFDIDIEVDNAKNPKED
tara:strand:- start:4274 stop:4552 length:279 start_codon:yes stop_codon:yes gene_type:complete